MITNAQLDELSKVEITPLPFQFGFCKGAVSIEEGYWEKGHQGSLFDNPEFHFSVIETEGPYKGEMDGDPNPEGEQFRQLEQALFHGIFEDLGEKALDVPMEITMSIMTKEFENDDPNEIWDKLIVKRLIALGGKEFPPQELGG